MNQNNFLKYTLIGLLLLTTGFRACLLHAQAPVLTPPDSNTGIAVENAVVLDGRPQVFFLTFPQIGDPNAGKDCGLNYYRAPVIPGAEAVAVASNVCSGLIQKSRMLEDGSALIVASRQLERWKDGEKVGEFPFGALSTISRQGIVNDLGGPGMLGISAQGQVIAVIQNSTGKLGVVSLTPQGEIAWQQEVPFDGMGLVGLSVEAAEGGALLTMTSAGVSSEDTRLYVFDGSGSVNSLDMTANAPGVSPEEMGNMNPEEMQAMFLNMAQSNPRSIKQISTRARPGGGYDVLYQLEGGAADKEGLYLLQLSSSGSKETQHFLGPILQDYEMREWADFLIQGKKLHLSGRILAFQEGVQAKRDRYMQNVIITVDLDSGRTEARLIPLDRQYLEAAMNAGDAEIRHLPGLPGGKPVLLASNGGRPVDVAVGSVGHRSVLRINQVNADSPRWSAGLDEERKAQNNSVDQSSQAEQMAVMQQHMKGMSDGSFFEAQIAELEKMMIDPNLSAEQRKQFEQSIEQLRKSTTSRN